MLSPVEVRELLRCSNMELRIGIQAWERDALNASRAHTAFSESYVAQCREKIDSARAILEQRLCGTPERWHRRQRGRY